MNQPRPATGGLAIVVAIAATLGFAVPVSPEEVAQSAIPLLSALSLATMCRTGDAVRPDPPWMRQSFGNDHCSLPDEPPTLDGTRASRDQLTAGLIAAQRFSAAADRYHECISAALIQHRQDAERTGNAVDVAFIAIETHRIVASDASKKRVRGQIAMAVDDFNAEGSECPQ